MDLPRDPNSARSPIRLVALYLAIGAGWLVLARWYVPSMLTAAHQGRGFLPPLNRWVQGRFHRHLNHYLWLWADFADSILLALFLHLGLCLLALHWARTPGGGPATDPARRTLVLAAFGLFLGLTVLSGPRQDYVAYLETWYAVGWGQDPWWIAPHLGYAPNAYGPLFVALAPLAWWNSLAPKLLFATSYLGMLLVFARTPPGPSWRWLTLAMGPFFWVEIAYFGHFDILVALACVTAVNARLRGDDGVAGLDLSLGFLLKFIPLALVPILAMDGRRVRTRLVAVAVVLMATGMGLAYWAWGPSSLRPLEFASGRGSNFASIFRYVRGPYSPLRAFGDPPNLDRLSLPCMLAFGLATLAVGQAFRFRADTSAVLASLVVITFYKVGFLQYQMIPVLLIISWIRGNEPTWSGDSTLRRATAAYLGWLTVVNLLLVWGGGVIHPEDPLGWLEDVVGLPTFLVGASLWFALVRANRRISP